MGSVGSRDLGAWLKQLLISWPYNSDHSTLSATSPPTSWIQHHMYIINTTMTYCVSVFVCVCVSVTFVFVCSYCTWYPLWDHIHSFVFLRRTRWPILFALSLCPFPAFQRHNGDIFTTASVKHLSHRRFVVSFQLDSIQRTDQDLYRCVTQSPRGSGVSNFAELVVKGKHSPSIFVSNVLVWSSSPFTFFRPRASFLFPCCYYDSVWFSALPGPGKLLPVIF